MSTGDGYDMLQDSDVMRTEFVCHCQREYGGGSQYLIVSINMVDVVTWSLLRSHCSLRRKAEIDFAKVTFSG